MELHNALTIIRLLIHFNMKYCKTTYTPLQARMALSKDGKDFLSNKTLYWRLAGALLLLTSTVQPDIAYVVSSLLRLL